MDTVGAGIPCDSRRGDRRRRRTIVLRERRDGFDRRAGGRGARVPWHRAAADLRTHPATLLALLAAINVLNVLDQLATERAIAAGSTEANPLLGALMAQDPVTAAGVKILAVLAVTLVVWELRRYRIVLQVGVLTFVLFASVLLWHYLGASLVY